MRLLGYQLLGYLGYLGYQSLRQSALSLIGIVGLVTLSQPLPTLAAELSEIRQRGVVIVGVKDNLPPLGFRQGQEPLQGLEIELARQIAQTLLGDPEAIAFKPLMNRDRLPALLNDEVDLVIAQFGVTAARSRLIDFSTPYYLDGTGILTRDASVQSLTDLRRRSIAVLQGSSTIAVVQSRLPQADLVGVASYQQARQRLDAGEVAAIAADATVLTGWLPANPEYRLLPDLISAQALAVGLPKGLQYQDLRQQVNRAIENWQRSGTLQQRILFWQLPEQGVPRLDP